MDEQTDGWPDGWMHRWISRWMIRWMDDGSSRSKVESLRTSGGQVKNVWKGAEGAERL